MSKLTKYDYKEMFSYVNFDYPKIDFIDNDPTATLRIVTENCIIQKGSFITLIEKGFIYDGFSCPKILSSVMGSRHSGTNVKPVFNHDIGYACEGTGKPLSVETLRMFYPEKVEERIEGMYKRSENIEYSKEEEDLVFNYSMYYFGTGYFVRNLAYYGVKFGGSSSWDKDKSIAEDNRKFITFVRMI